MFSKFTHYKSTFKFCKKIRVFLFALLLLAAADIFWIVELKTKSSIVTDLSQIAPASGGGQISVFDVNFSAIEPQPVEKQVISPLKNSELDKLTAKPPQNDAQLLPPKKKQIAIVIDDLGIDKKRSKKIVEMSNFKMTLAFLPYAKNMQGLLDEGVENGHELIVHMPMEPKSAKIDPGPVVLRVGMTAEQLDENIDKGLGAFDGFVGINNHMGSKFTSDFVGMDYLMRQLKKRDLYFLDSVTSASSKAESRALAHGVTYLKRDVFLDHEMTDEFVSRALSKCEKRAEQNGLCIAIGHPKDVTIKGLNNWVEHAKTDGFEFVTLSDIINKRKPKDLTFVEVRHEPNN